MEKAAVNNISISFDPSEHLLRGESVISIPAGGTAKVDTAGLQVLAASVNGLRLSAPFPFSFTAASGSDVLKIEYEVRLDGGNGGSTVGPSGIFLVGRWYPSIEGLAVYNLTAVLPGEFEGISEAEKISVREVSGGKREFSFSFPYPRRTIGFAAGRYTTRSEECGGTEVRVYIPAGTSVASDKLTEKTRMYLSLYERLIGKFPYKMLSLVNTDLPADYSGPSLLMLHGTDAASGDDGTFGRALLGQWFGNFVYVDSSGGDWSEGLTTYLAEPGDRPDFRRELIGLYQGYVRPEDDIPLSSFRDVGDRISEAVGRAKSAMVFHMLRTTVGEEDFWGSLGALVKKYGLRYASWKEIGETFGDVSGKQLDRFFTGWVQEKGIAEIEVKNVGLAYKGRRAEVAFQISQKGRTYKMPVNVVLRTSVGEESYRFDVEKETADLKIDTEGSPEELVIDGKYDLFRKLSDAEFPADLARFLGDGKKLFVVPAERGDDFSSLVDFLKKEGVAAKKEGEITYDDMKTSSLILLRGTGLADRIFGRLENKATDFSLTVKENPFNKTGVIALVTCPLPGDAVRYFRRVMSCGWRCGKFRSISFSGEREDLGLSDAGDKGIRARVAPDVPGVETSHVTDVAGVAENVRDKEIVYIGEVHNRFEDHRVQLDIIRRLYERNGKIAIGMEMFQKPFQQVLDDYVAGRLEEKEFLKRSEYFKRWGYDYNLYREILAFARECGIPVIALNIRKEIVEKVSREGIYSLTRDDLMEVPEDIDFSDEAYKARLREYFGKHPNPEGKNFDFFFQSQVLWDESMAHNLVEFMRKNPDDQVVVLAGVGHMAFGSGIPRRAFRLNKKDYSIVVCGDEVDKDISDFILMPEEVPHRESPLLMVQLKKDDRGVAVTSFPAGSVSENAGLRKDDVILALDDTRVSDIDDIKIFLLYKEKGDEITVTVLRKRFLLGDTVTKIKVKL